MTTQAIHLELKKSRTAFFESVRTLHMAYLTSRQDESQSEDETDDDAILAALALELGYTTSPDERTHQSCQGKDAAL